MCYFEESHKTLRFFMDMKFIHVTDEGGENRPKANSFYKIFSNRGDEKEILKNRCCVPHMPTLKHIYEECFSHQVAVFNM